MLHRIVATGFQNIVETYHVALDIGIRIRDRVPDTCLCAEIHHDVRVVLIKDTVDECLVRKVSLDKGVVLELLKLCKTSFLDTDIIVIVHVVQTDDLCIRLSGQDTLGKVGSDKTG